MMKTIKKYLGIVWLLAGPVIIYLLVAGAMHNIDPAGTKDINNPVIWVIIITIFLPIAIGLMIFGWYALHDEYHELPQDSDAIS